MALGAGDALAGQLPVPLGKAGSFAALAGSTVTSAGFSTLDGDLGVSPGTSLTGFPPSTVTGTKHAGDPFASQAQGDLTAAYNDAASRTQARALPADVGGTTLTPGAYKTQATPALGLTGRLTLDGQGDPNAVFVIQVGSALTTNVGSQVNLIGGARAGNVFWQIGSSATLGTSSTFAGSILALTSISINSGVTLTGRALARNGAVTLINDTITAPTASPPITAPTASPPPPPPPKYIAYSIGQLYKGSKVPFAPYQGSLDTRPSARALGGALARLGYVNREKLKGQTPRAVLREAPKAAVISIFNHAGPGNIITGGGGTRACDPEGLVARRRACHGRFLGLDELPRSALSGVRLMIFAGCNTADTDRRYGNLMQIAKKLGVGSVIGFHGFIFSSAPGPNASRVSGNYFWARFAVYVRRGWTIESAFNQADRDLFNQRGLINHLIARAYSNAVIGGASSRPGSLRLTINGPHAASAAAEQTTRRDQRGDIVSFGSPASTAGPRRLSVAAARFAATRFLAQRAPHVASAGLKVISQQPAGVGPGEELESFSYSSLLGGVQGPAAAQVEVDLRNGKVVSEAAGRVTPSSTRFTLTRGQAQAAARAAVHERGAVVSTEKDIWSSPRWVVTLRAPGGATAMVEIDAANGHVASVNYADPSS